MSQCCENNSKIVWRIEIPWLTTLRSSVIGFFCGFTPVLSNIMSSNVAYSIEKFLLGNNYRRDGDVRALVASESANNAGNIGCLIPLLAFGIPIVASEAVLFEITNTKGLIYSLDWVLQNFHWIAGTFLVANVIGFLCSWPLARMLSKIVSLFSNYFKWTIIVLLVLICFWAGWREAQAMYYMILAAIFLPIGLLLRKFDLLPLVVIFMLSTLIENNAVIVWNLYTG
jgi:putative tricarboxylic transport membrane protein